MPRLTIAFAPTQRGGCPDCGGRTTIASPESDHLDGPRAGDPYGDGPIGRASLETGDPGVSVGRVLGRQRKRKFGAARIANAIARTGHIGCDLWGYLDATEYPLGARSTY